MGLLCLFMHVHAFYPKFSRLNCEAGHIGVANGEDKLFFLRGNSRTHQDASMLVDAFGENAQKCKLSCLILVLSHQSGKSQNMRGPPPHTLVMMDHGLQHETEVGTSDQPRSPYKNMDKGSTGSTTTATNGAPSRVYVSLSVQSCLSPRLRQLL